MDETSKSVRADESRDFHSLHDATPSLDLDALKLALTHLDHSLQKGKAFVGRSGALSNRRPPSRESRSSRRSSADSLQLLQDQADLEEDLVIPRVVNIEVQVENDNKDSKNGDHQKSSEKPINCVRNRDFTFREQLQEPKLYRTHEKRRGLDSFSANQEIRKKLFETRNKKTFGGSNPLLSSTHESEESFRRIKEEVARLAAKRRSSSDITELWPPSDLTSNTSVTDSQRSEAARKWNEERESLLESASTIFEREGDENRSSSEADFVISDRESIADSGLVNRRTVIKISEKKSKSATNLISENPVPLWIRDLQTRRSLRSGKDQSTTRVIPIEVDPAFEGGINVSIVNQPEPPRKESTSRMYVRQSDSENRPSRASAFNVRRTIEKRQIQQERRERRALREQIKEQLRSLSEERERRDSSSSHVSSTHISQNSVRSKSMSSLDQDQDDFRSESPLFKVQSSPTLEKEKEGIRSYLFGVSNLTESGPPSHDMSPTSRDVNVTEEYISDTENICESLKSEQNNLQDSERSSIRETIKSCDSLETENTKNTRRSHSFNRSTDSIHGTSTHNLQNTNTGSSLHQITTEEIIRSPSSYKRDKLINTQTKYKSDTSDISNTENTVQQNLIETVPTNRDSFSHPKEDDQPETRPIPPPRKHRLSLSAGHITLEGEEKPNWIRLAKERRSLRSAKPVDQLSDRASSTCQEPEWVAKARRKLEALNVTLTSTTDFNSVSSHITESSSAWSRGGLDALDDLREETSRIGVELAEEASARVNEDLSANKITNKMIEHNTDRSRDQSAERPRVSFDSSAVETSDGESSRRYRSRKPQKDEVRFGDLKHDWGGVQSKSPKATTGKTKEMRFGETPTKDSVCESPPERTKELRFGDHMKGSSAQKCHSNPTSPSGNLPVMRFGDTPLNLFPDSQAKKVQSSSKFESVAGPDPTKMTAEQLNQNVEEYDFPIPTGKEDVTEFMKFLEDSLKKVEIVPEVVCSEEPKPKPKSILKRRSVENVFLELKKEEKNEFHQKVEHRKSASFDWDTVGKGGDASLDTGHLRNNGIKLSTEHFNQHAEVSNRVKRSPQHNSSTSTSIATNSSFFNVKLRHVASNKHELAVTKDSHRFHTEHNPLKRPQGLNINTSKHNEDFSSVNSFSNGREAKIGNTGVSKGTDWHGASSAPSPPKENISDFGSYSEADYTGNENPRDNHLQSLEEYKMIVRKISKKELPVGGGENGIHVSRWPPETSERTKESKKQGYAPSTSPSGEGTTVPGRTVQDLLQKVQEPPAAWGTCRAGRGLDATEPMEDDDKSSSPSSNNSQTSVDTADRGKNPCNFEMSFNLDLKNGDNDSISRERHDESQNDTRTQWNSPPEYVRSTSNNPSESDSPANNRKYEAAENIAADDDTPICETKESNDFSSEDINLPSDAYVPILGKEEESTFTTYRKEKATTGCNHTTDTKLTPPLTIVPSQTASYTASHELTPVLANKAVEDEQASPPPSPTIPVITPAEAPENDVSDGVSVENEVASPLCQLRDDESQGKKRQAKVFSFTFNPEQKITSKPNFTSLEEDSLLQQKTQKEAENKRRTEGTKTFMIITNPNAVSKTHELKEVPELVSHTNNFTKFQNIPEKIRSKSQPKNEVQSESPSSYTTKTSEANVISSWKKLVTQNLSNSNEERRKSFETISESSPRQKVHQVKLEVVDDEQKKHSTSKREEERRRSSLLEWEAMQRQRLEDEEKNRINKNLSIKPVSAKIKELVKIHGSFMSMFSKDKKTDINGTVDGKDDIVFRKISCDNTTTNANGQPFQGSPLPMKSPYIVKKLLMPSKSYVSEDSKTHKYGSKDMSKPPSSGHRTSHVSRSSSKSRSVKDRSESPVKMHMREKSQFSAKYHSTRDRSPSPSKTRASGEQSSSSSKVIRSPSPIKRTTRERSPSPAKLRTSRARSPSPAKLHSSRRRSPSPAKFRTSRGRSPSPANIRTSRRSPSPANIRTSRRSPSPANIRTSRRSPSPANIRTSRGRSPASSKLYTSQERSVSPSKVLKTRERSPSPMGEYTRMISSSPHRIRTVRERSLSPLKSQLPDKLDLLAGTFIEKESRSVIRGDIDTVDGMDNAKSPEPPVQRPMRSNFKIKKAMGTSQAPKSLPSSSQENENVNSNDNEVLMSSKDLNYETKIQSSAQISFNRISPPIPPKPYFAREILNHSNMNSTLNSKEESQEDTESSSPHEIRKSECRSSIKDPKNRKEWLNKMLNTISTDNVPLDNTKFPSTSMNMQFKGQNDLKVETTNLFEDKDLTFSKTDKSSVLLENSFSNVTGSTDQCPSNLSTTALECLPGAKLRYKLASKHLHESSNLYDTNSLISDAQVYLNKHEMSPPSTPKSLGSSYGELHESSQTKSSRRGPVSLSSIIGDTSSRSSSLASTPLTSPRATPERVIRKDSLDIISKLGVIPEARLRESVQLSPSVEEHKENIAPVNISGRNREDGESFSYQPSSRYSPWFTERQKDMRDASRESSPEHDNGSSPNIHNNAAKPYTFGKPSVTMKSLLQGVSLQKNSNNWRSQIFSDEEKEDSPHLKSTYSQKDSYLSNSYPRDNRDPIAARFSKERVSLKAKLVPEPSENVSPNHRYLNVSEHKIRSPNSKMKALSERFSPERKDETVSLASILTRNEGPKYSISEETFSSRFESKSPYTKETNEIVQRRHEDTVHGRYSSDDATPVSRIAQPSLLADESDDVSERNSVSTKGECSRASSMEPTSKESSPVREICRGERKHLAKGKPTSAKKTKDVSGPSAPPRGLTRRNSNSGKQRTRVVRRNSSLKRNRPDDPKALASYKKERKASESDSADIKSETVVQDEAGWTKTKTTVRRARLGSPEKTKQIVRTNSGKTRKEKTFKADASKALEEWAAGTNVEGKLMKKEGQKFSHETEEEVKGGQRTTRGITRRVIRRGSRRLSSGGELLTETKEMSSEGAPKDQKNSDSPEDSPSKQSETLAIDDGLSRKMKTSTDGERYVTQSVLNKDGKQTFTTEGVNNKTTNSVEVIGGDDFEAKREVLGKTGYRVLVERSKDMQGRPSTVVRKVTSQSRVVITKTKKKSPVVV
ncbi:serine/arginine repetitive matrix protein 2-like [Palaemon carinicauda]|uniref:serine/arginine repetitive matrix protein 2-like n=1 Tax=Palaemon carinicauda TaxID=392227 RepID=UPI0035B60715